MKKENEGAGILTVLEIVFGVLKLTGVVAWSWWAVLIPLWIALGLWMAAGAAVVSAFVYVLLFKGE